MGGWKNQGDPFGLPFLSAVRLTNRLENNLAGDRDDADLGIESQEHAKSAAKDSLLSSCSESSLAS